MMAGAMAQQLTHGDDLAGRHPERFVYPEVADFSGTCISSVAKTLMAASTTTSQVNRWNRVRAM
jgi:hypothetical protein